MLIYLHHNKKKINKANKTLTYLDPSGLNPDNTTFHGI